MFARLLSSLLGQEPQDLPDPEARLALGALLVRLARADEVYSEDEALRIDRVLATRYGLSAFAATALRRDAEILETQAPDTVRFTRALKQAVPLEDRMGLLQALWSVAFADGARSAEEDALIRLVANLLGISDRDSAVARQAVEKDQA